MLDNLRIELECKGGHWWFTLYRNGPHSSSRGYATPNEAVNEAMHLNSAIRLSKGSAERKLRRMESVKTHGVVTINPINEE
jgi:hypothetical protein